MGALQVGVLAYPGCFGSEVFGVPDLLTMAGHVAAAQGDAGEPVTTTILAARPSVAVSGGAVLDVAPVRAVDVLVVPGFAGTPRADLDARLTGLTPEIAAIRAQHAGGGAVVSICVGAFLLADADLLAGRRATTSWLFADALSRRRPAARVRADELVVTDRGVTTTAAFSAMFDFALDLVRAHHGPRTARRTARIGLVDDARSSQTPYVDTELLPATGRPFADAVARELDRDVAAPYDLPALARTLHVSTRTLLRRFRSETGRTPLAHLQAARVDRARHLLESTDRTVASIASAVGYADPSTFGTVFARHTGRRPREYRASFRPHGTRGASAAGR